MSSRIPTSQIYKGAHQCVATAKEREAKTAEKAATQKEIIRPSDNPTAYMKASAVKDDLGSREVIGDNAKYAQNVLSSTETLFEQVNEGLIRAYELTLSISGDTGGGEQGRKAVLSEVEGIYQSMLQTLNYKFGPRTLLAGYKSQGPAFNRDGNFVGGKGEIEIEVDKGSRVAITVNAERAVLGKGMPNGVNIIESMKSLMEGLRENDTDKIRPQIDSLQKGVEQMSMVRAEIGGRMKAVESAMGRNAHHEVDMKTVLSEMEEVDAVKVFSDLARDQTILQAALATSKKIIDGQNAGILLQ